METNRINDLKLNLRNGWKLDVLCCVETMDREFTFKEFCDAHRAELQRKHPENKFVDDKIRQQLQYLRDLNIIEFKERGVYCVIE